MFEQDLLTADNQRDEAELVLRRPLPDDELRLHFQPKVALDTDRIVGVEALVRWQHPQRRMVTPLELIPLAEATGLIAPIGAWVIEEACRVAARWRHAFLTDLSSWCRSTSVRQFGPGLDGADDRRHARNAAGGHGRRPAR